MATLYSVVKTLQNTALEQPNVRTVGENHLYDMMNGNPSVRYSVFYVTQTTHRSNDLFDVWGFNLFYIDRLLDDRSNELEIESTAKQVLDNVVDKFCARYNAEVTGIRKYQSFTEHFKDECAGMYVTLEIEVPREIICPE